MAIFIKQEITLHSGLKSDFKIECDSLSNEDIETISYMIGQKLEFSDVIGVPRGGLRLADALKKYTKNKFKDPFLLSSPPPILIVDDVLTTGGSMNEFKNSLPDNRYIGVVIFARGKTPSWIIPLFQMW